MLKARTRNYLLDLRNDAFRTFTDTMCHEALRVMPGTFGFHHTHMCRSRTRPQHGWEGDQVKQDGGAVCLHIVETFYHIHAKTLGGNQAHSA